MNIIHNVMSHILIYVLNVGVDPVNIYCICIHFKSIFDAMMTITCRRMTIVTLLVSGHITMTSLGNSHRYLRGFDRD